jgi:hypothetical protein
MGRWWARAVRSPERATAALPREITIRGQHVWITAQSTGLVVRRRSGLAAWVPICTLAWTDIEMMELDPRTHMLCVATRFTRGLRPLLDRTHLTPGQWVVLRDAVAAWTGQGVRIDLTHLEPAPHDEP